jgi:hypothetical protein
MHYKFSGLMLWEDLDMNGQMDVNMDEIGSAELSHYLIPSKPLGSSHLEQLMAIVSQVVSWI